MRTTMRQDLTTALKARDRVAIAALRSALAAMDNAEAVHATDLPATTSEHVAGAAVGLGAAEAERRHLTDADLRAVVAKEIEDRTTAAKTYADAGREDAAQQLRAEADVLARYLQA